MKRTATLFFAIILVTIGAAAAFGQKRSLEGTSWKLVEANGVRVTNSAAALSFDERARNFSGNTGCNAMSGTVDVRGRNIDFGPARTSKRACKLMAGNVAEGIVLSGLSKARSYDTRGESLRLYDRRGRTLLRFKADVVDVNEGGSRLEDRVWVLEQIKGRQTFVALPRATLNFDPRKMSVGGDTSCNAFGGEYSVASDQIKIRNVISTMRACVEDSKMSVEREFLNGLRTANRFEIADGRLKLYRGRELLLTFRGERK